MRVARRDALRHKGRTLLIVLLVGVPVAAMSVGLTLGATAARTPDQQVAARMGQADLLVSTAAVPAEEWQAALSSGSRWTPMRDFAYSAAIVEGEELFEPYLFEADLADPLLAGRAELVEGRPAVGPDEVVVSPALADDLEVAVGDRLALARPDRVVTVVGQAVQFDASVDGSLLFAPVGWAGGSAADTVLEDRGPEWLVDVGAADPGTTATFLEERFASGRSVSEAHSPSGDPASVPEALPSVVEGGYIQALTRPEALAFFVDSVSGTADQVSVTLVAGALALVWTGAVAAAAFAVGARRRLREVGLVAASGGAPVHLRRLLLADGLVLGAAGALSGVLVGVLLAAAARPHLDRVLGHPVDGLRVPVMALAGAAMVGCVAAVLAAVVPARSAARVPVLSALAGLRPVRARHRSWLAVGVVTLGLGVASSWQGGSSGNDLLVVVGVLLVVFGVAATTGPLLALVSRLSGAAPLTLRLAARDAGRSRGRAGPATVAAMLALAGSVGFAAFLESSEARFGQEYVPYLRDDQLSLTVTRSQSPVPSEVDALVAAAVGAVPGAVAGPLASLRGDEGQTFIVVGDVEQEGEQGDVYSLEPANAQLFVGDVDTLDALGASAARQALEDGQVVALNGGAVDEDGTVTLRRIVQGERVEELDTLPAVEFGTGTPTSFSKYLVSFETAEVLGLTPQLSTLILRAPGPVTDVDVRRVNLAALEAVPSVPIYTQREIGLVTVSYILPAILGAGALIALFVVGLVTALSREELRPHLGTLAAVGAAPRTRRGFAAAQSGLLAGMAALLAVPAGLVPAVTLLRAQSRDVVNGVSTLSEGAVPVVIPWLAIAALVVGVTVLSTLGGGLFTRAQERCTA